MSNVTDLAAYRAQKQADKKEQDRRAAIARIIARCPVWPDDPPEKK